MRADRPKSPLHGILLVDKPQGWTSHDVVAKARGLTQQRKIGHTGTLDPMATGLLVLCLGDATRLVEYMSRHDKGYEGLITLGVTTDTDDAEGTPTGQGSVPVITAAELADLEARFTGELLQRPPAYSAVKVAGKRAYAVARGGGTVELAERPVQVHSLRLTAVASDGLSISVRCGPGTYIRSLARDIGEALGCGAHLSALRRTRVGLFDLDSACSLEDVAALCSAGRIDEFLLQPDEGVPEMAAAIVSDATAARLWHGQAVPVTPINALPGGPGRIYSASGAFVGIGDFDAFGQLRPTKVVTNRG
jgi:tRNA pseudouridine55 synthase